MLHVIEFARIELTVYQTIKVVSVVVDVNGLATVQQIMEHIVLFIAKYVKYNLQMPI